ncbi:MAG TPA: PAS domain S-box protein [Thermoanaerobaculia bacterium]|nr:PAS domain S-box protein [Thermoanaerobaculia bacterium]
MKLLFVAGRAGGEEPIAALLREFGFDFTAATVTSLSALHAALAEKWSAVIALYELSGMSVVDALESVRTFDPQIPFVVVAEPSVGNEQAGALLRAGVNDFLWKDRLSRLGPTIDRELRSAQIRTEHRSFFDALRRSEARYRRVFEKAPLGIATITSQGRFINVNERLAEIFGTTREAVTGRMFTGIQHPDDEPPPFDGSMTKWEGRVRRADGMSVWVSITIAPINSEGGDLEEFVWIVEDISARISAEDALRSSREQLAAAQSIARVGSYEYDLATGRRIWSEELFRIYGLEPQSEVDMAYADALIHPDDAEMVMQRRAQTIQTLAAFEGDHRIIRPDGQVRTLNGRGYTVRDDQGRAIKVIGVLQDVTEARAQERELKLRVQQQHAIAELSKVALRGVDQQTLMLACELVASRLHTRHALLFDTGGTAMHLAAGTAEASGDAALVAAAAAASRHRVEGCILDDDPDLARLGQRSAIVVPIAGTLPFGAIAAFSPAPRAFVAADVQFVEALANILAEAMERDNGRRELAASEERYRAVVEGASEIILSLSPEGRLTTLNAAFDAVTGLRAEEWLGRSWLDLVRSDGRAAAAAAFEAAIASSEGVTTEITFEGPGGPVILEMSMIASEKNGRTVVYGFGRDITERLLLEARLEQANRIASLGRLAATVAHEFNNVLMGISPFIEVLRRGRNIESSLDHIARAVKRGKRVTEDILRFTQPAEPARVALDVHPWLQNVALEARSLLPPSCTLEVSVSDPSLRIDGDPNQLQQIFTNLVLNARDAMPNGGSLTIRAVREKPGTKLSFGVIENPEQFAHFIVRDTGCGMSDDVLRHIFEPLFTTKRNGTGLGVPVALQVVQRHGGDMFVESTVGAGTAFHIFLPLATSAYSAMDVLPDHGCVAPATRVLLVEDDASVSSGIVMLLELEGVSVRCAGTGAAALEELQAELPDLVVLDVGLPDIEGTLLYETIAARYPTLPVIFSTGHADRSKIEDLLGQPHVGFLLKPYEVATLLSVMREVIAAA